VHCRTLNTEIASILPIKKETSLVYYLYPVAFSQPACLGEINKFQKLSMLSMYIRSGASLIAILEALDQFLINVGWNFCR
jgi:hypothetical protein